MKTFLNKNNSGITQAQAASFFTGLAAVTAASNPYKTPGARKLFPYRDLLTHAVRTNPNVKSWQLIDIVLGVQGNPLKGLSETTARQYMSQARTEFKINSYSQW